MLVFIYFLQKILEFLKVLTKNIKKIIIFFYYPIRILYTYNNQYKICKKFNL